MTETMFTMDGDVLRVTLPQGHTMAELTEMCAQEIDTLIERKVFAGKDVKIDGRITTSMALHLGHKLAHVCRSVSIYDPKENVFVVSVRH